MLNTLTWVPASSVAYDYVIPGGVRIRSGVAGNYFWNCPINLPAGSTIQSISVHVNPGGAGRTVNLARYDGSNPTFVDIKSAASSAGNAVETVTVAAIDHVVLPAPWQYRIDNFTLSGTAALYGGLVITSPLLPDSSPWRAVRVYDTRTGGQSRLAPNEERIVCAGAARAGHRAGCRGRPRRQRRRWAAVTSRSLPRTSSGPAIEELVVTTPVCARRCAWRPSRAARRGIGGCRPPVVPAAVPLVVRGLHATG